MFHMTGSEQADELKGIVADFNDAVYSGAAGASWTQDCADLLAEWGIDATWELGRGYLLHCQHANALDYHAQFIASAKQIDVMRSHLLAGIFPPERTGDAIDYFVDIAC